MTVRLLRAADVRQACPMSDAIDVVAAGFAALSTGQATVPVRLSVPLRGGAVALAMPAALTGASCYSVKVVTVAPSNAAAGRPVVIGTVLLGDAVTGEVPSDAHPGPVARRAYRIRRRNQSLAEKSVLQEKCPSGIQASSRNRNAPGAPHCSARGHRPGPSCSHLRPCGRSKRWGW